MAKRFEDLSKFRKVTALIRGLYNTFSFKEFKNWLRVFTTVCRIGLKGVEKLASRKYTLSGTIFVPTYVRLNIHVSTKDEVGFAPFGARLPTPGVVVAEHSDSLIVKNDYHEIMTHPNKLVSSSVKSIWYNKKSGWENSAFFFEPGKVYTHNGPTTNIVIECKALTDTEWLLYSPDVT